MEEKGPILLLRKSQNMNELSKVYVTYGTISNRYLISIHSDTPNTKRYTSTNCHLLKFPNDGSRRVNTNLQQDVTSLSDNNDMYNVRNMHVALDVVTDIINNLLVEHGFSVSR